MCRVVGSMLGVIKGGEGRPRVKEALRAAGCKQTHIVQYKLKNAPFGIYLPSRHDFLCPRMRSPTCTSDLSQAILKAHPNISAPIAQSSLHLFIRGLGTVLLITLIFLTAPIVSLNSCSKKGGNLNE